MKLDKNKKILLGVGAGALGLFLYSNYKRSENLEFKFSNLLDIDFGSDRIDARLEMRLINPTDFKIDVKQIQGAVRIAGATGATFSEYNSHIIPANQSGVFAFNIVIKYSNILPVISQVSTAYASTGKIPVDIFYNVRTNLGKFDGVYNVF